MTPKFSSPYQKNNSPDRVSRLETALVHLTSWFYHNGLASNPEKSEAILLGTHPRNKSLDNITQVDVNGSPIPISDSIKLLGVTIDSSLAFNKHVSLICQSCQYLIRQNMLAGVVLRTNRLSSAGPMLNELHWLPVASRIQFKIATLAHKILSTGTPSYLSSLLSHYKPDSFVRPAQISWYNHPPKLNLALLHFTPLHL